MLEQLNLETITAKQYAAELERAIKDGELSKREKEVLHVRQEHVEYSSENGRRLSRPVLQKYNVKEWDGVRDYLQANGYALDILFDPREQKAIRAERREEAKATETSRKGEVTIGE